MRYSRAKNASAYSQGPPGVSTAEACSACTSPGKRPQFTVAPRVWLATADVVDEDETTGGVDFYVDKNDPLLVKDGKRRLGPTAEFPDEGVYDRFQQFVAADRRKKEAVAGTGPAFQMRHLVDRQGLLAAPEHPLVGAQEHPLG